MSGKHRPDTRRDIVEAGLAAYTITECCGYARIDMRMDENERIYVLKSIPTPIFTDAAAAIQAVAHGMSYNEFIQ